MAAAVFIFAAIFAVSAYSQGAPQSAAGYKIVVIDTGAFDNKDGIQRYVNAMNGLEAEFKPVSTKIDGMITRYNSLGAEIKKIQEQISAGSTGGVAPPIDQKAAEAKVVEYQTLEKNIKREQEDAKANFERRQQQVMGPLLQEIGKAMQEYANQKGYDLILDAAKLDNAGLILAFNPARVDVTKDFITFFNARPANAATASAPK